MTLPEAVYSLCDADPTLDIETACALVALQIVPNKRLAKRVLAGEEPAKVLRGSVALARYWWLVRETRRV